MTRSRFQLATAWAGSIILAVAVMRDFGGRAGGYFDRPTTVMDHVWRSGRQHGTREAFLLVPRMRQAAVMRVIHRLRMSRRRRRRSMNARWPARITATLACCL